MLAVIAVPAMAAPGDFGALPGDATSPPSSVASFELDQLRQPFEIPGNSFPGSAFYFLADAPDSALIALPETNPVPQNYSARELGSLIDAGPAASPFNAKLSGKNFTRAMHCMTQAVYYEAASEGAAGQRAVAQVVLNRLSHPSWPNSVCGVVYQGSHRSTGCQFTFTCDGSLARQPAKSSWKKAMQVATDALSGAVFEPIGMATHYHAHWVDPHWAKSLNHVGTIGAHKFYQNRGTIGKRGAFTAGHSGEEANVFERQVRQTYDASSAKEAVRPAIGPAVRAAQASSGSSEVISVPKDPEMHNAGQVKSQFSNAGQWKDTVSNRP